ncbi:hypothetical protein MSAN_00752900 [Mycena sanguinolenta]|uniref:Uncharacterized protein n=1 Tax=Mycena sanguinolenta TaxID=230812 RepID=A0A8H6Z562_9AGAR|nr:hypothetical protein MSAN_00752900 [Mycena sanguinolenta]
MANRQTMSVIIQGSLFIGAASDTVDRNDINQQVASTEFPAATNSDDLGWKPCKTRACQNLVPPQPPLSRRRIVKCETCRQKRRLRDQVRSAQQIRSLSEGEGVTKDKVKIDEQSDNSHLRLEIDQMQVERADMADFVRSLQREIAEQQESQRETAEHIGSLQAEISKLRASLPDSSQPVISSPLLLEYPFSIETEQNEQEVEHQQDQAADFARVLLQFLWHALKIVCYILCLLFRSIGTVGLCFALWLLNRLERRSRPARAHVPDSDIPDGRNSENLPPPYDSVSSPHLASGLGPIRDNFLYPLLVDVSLSHWFDAISSTGMTVDNLRTIARFDDARRDAFFARLIPSMDAVDRALLVDAVGRFD